MAYIKVSGLSTSSSCGTASSAMLCFVALVKGVGIVIQQQQRFYTLDL